MEKLPHPSNALPPPATRHFTKEEISELRNRTSLDPDVALRLVEHLDTRCPTCWTSLDEVGRYEWDGPDTVDPALAALRRLTARSKRPSTLTGAHIGAFRAVVARPFGFSFLVVEEALALGSKKSFDVASLVRVLGLGDTDFTTVSSEPPRADVFCQATAAAARIHLEHGRHEAATALFEGLLHSQSFDLFEREETRLKIHETMACCSRAVADLPTAYRELRKALHLSRNHLLRHFDVARQLADLLTAMYRGGDRLDGLPRWGRQDPLAEVEGGPREVLIALLAHMEELCQAIYGAEDFEESALRQENAFMTAFRMAGLLYLIDGGMRIHARRPEDPPPSSDSTSRTLLITDVVAFEVLESTYERLRLAAAYFAPLDPWSRTERVRYLFNLSLFVDGDNALPLARELHQGLEQLGAEYWTEALAAKTVLVALERRRDPVTAERSAHELFAELRAWLPQGDLMSFFNEVAERLPSGSVRDLLPNDFDALLDDDGPTSVS